MNSEKERVDAYQNTIQRLEPEIAMIDADAALASIAISLKRIADSLDRHEGIAFQRNEILSSIEMSVRNK